MERNNEFRIYKYTITEREEEALLHNATMEKIRCDDNEELEVQLSEIEKQEVLSQDKKDYQDWARYCRKRKREGSVGRGDFITSHHEWRQRRLDKQRFQKEKRDTLKDLRIWRNRNMVGHIIFNENNDEIDLCPEMIVLPDYDEYYVAFNLKNNTKEFCVLDVLEKLRDVHINYKPKDGKKFVGKVWIDKEANCFASYYTKGKNPFEENLKNIDIIGRRSNC